MACQIKLRCFFCPSCSFSSPFISMYLKTFFWDNRWSSGTFYPIKYKNVGSFVLLIKKKNNRLLIGWLSAVLIATLWCCDDKASVSDRINSICYRWINFSKIMLWLDVMYASSRIKPYVVIKSWAGVKLDLWM